MASEGKMTGLAAVVNQKVLVVVVNVVIPTGLVASVNLVKVKFCG